MFFKFKHANVLLNYLNTYLKSLGVLQVNNIGQTGQAHKVLKPHAFDNKITWINKKTNGSK